jgi:hypothetical protein
MPPRRCSVTWRLTANLPRRLLWQSGGVRCIHLAQKTAQTQHGKTMNLRSGVKIYDNDWFIRHSITVEGAADLLASWNITYVIAQSRYLPMQNSAIPSAVSALDAARYRTLDDVAFRHALAARGIAYFACLNIGFDPIYAAAHPALLPIDQQGERAEADDWYIGLPPDRAENTAHKIGLLQQAVSALQPDGIHLGFVRWPGFWETWLPGIDWAAKPQYCFSAATLTRFTAATALTLPIDDPAAAAALIAARYRPEWTAWKCQVTVAQIRSIRAALDPIRPGMQVSINTLPFFREDFDGAVESVFGQDVRALSEVVDVFEVMAYHQIMRQPAAWPGAVAADIRARSGRAAICTVQAKALYLEGQHAGQGRATALTADDFSAALDGIEASPVDGACVFTFTDLLDQRGTPRGDAMIDRLTRFRL